MQPKYKLQNDNPENVYLKIDISICPDPIFFFFWFLHATLFYVAAQNFWDPASFAFYKPIIYVSVG